MRCPTGAGPRHLHAVLDDIGSAWRQQRGPARRDHRPYPMPDGPWLFGQSWLDLLFAHWRVDEARLRRVLPPALTPELIDGSAWVGLAAFELRAMRARLTLPAPFVSAFPELNLRTYVTVRGQPGVYFLSLDAGSRLAVEAARRAFRLPYFHARMSIDRIDGAIEYRSERDDPSALPARFEATFAPRGSERQPRRGSLEWTLTERYCAYTLDERRRVLRAQIHHPPWTLRDADADFAENTMAKPFGIVLEGEPLLHFAARQDAVLWRLERARS